MLKALIVSIALLLVGTASASESRFSVAYAAAHDNASQVFLTALNKFGLRKALHAKAMLTACGNSSHDDALERAAWAIDLSALKDSNLVSAPEASADESSRLLVQELRGLEVGYLMGYSERILVEMLTDSERKRENCALADSLAREVIADADAL